MAKIKTKRGHVVFEVCSSWQVYPFQALIDKKIVSTYQHAGTGKILVAAKGVNKGTLKAIASKVLG